MIKYNYNHKPPTLSKAETSLMLYTTESFLFSIAGVVNFPKVVDLINRGKMTEFLSEKTAKRTSFQKMTTLFNAKR